MSVKPKIPKQSRECRNLPKFVNQIYEDQIFLGLIRHNQDRTNLKLIQAIFNSNLRDKKYISDSSRNLVTNLSELIRTQVKQELGKQNR